MVAISTPAAKANKPSVTPDNTSITPDALISHLQADYPDFRFLEGSKFAFRPPRTIIIGPPQPFFALLTLHELAHALCKHKSYDTHVSRIRIESEAWERAKALSADYGISWNEDFVQDQLDTYRDWLHIKSLCPTCHLTRFQTPDGDYHCPHCDMLQ